MEPKFFHEAVKKSCWKQAMINLTEALEKNNTWSVVDFLQERSSSTANGYIK